MLKQKNKYAPDVLDCIANLSNDEVFTSPKLANQMLDMVPQELFTSPNTKFLDPCCKSGVFLREIVKRLEDIILDRQARVDHILHKQVFDIGDKLPVEYVEKYKDKFGEEYKTHCDNHALPENFEAMDYMEFLSKRRTLMAQIVKKAFMRL